MTTNHGVGLLLLVVGAALLATGGGAAAVEQCIAGWVQVCSSRLSLLPNLMLLCPIGSILNLTRKVIFLQFRRISPPIYRRKWDL